MCIDLLAWSCFIYLSGGATNPLISVFLPLVAFGAQVLGRTHAWILGGLATLAYTFLWVFHQPLAIQDALLATRLHIFGMWLVFVVSAIVVIWFILNMTQAVRDRDAALARAREQALRNEWLVSLGSMAAGAAHSLSTPLATMNALMDDLLDDPASTSEIRTDLSLMKRQMDRCKEALTQLTHRSGHARGQQTRVVAPDAWIRSMTESWLALNPAASIRLCIAPELAACRTMANLPLEQSLFNLLDNALQAGASNLAIDATLGKDQLRLRIEDDGPGIAPGMHHSFAAGHPVSSGDGMGVGLQLAAAAIEHLGGTLRIDPLPQGGTCAELTLPLHDSPAHADDSENSQPRRRAKESFARRRG